MENRQIPARTLAEIVDQYMMLSFNDKRKYYLNYLVAAQWAWKELLWDTIWQVKSKYVDVDKTTTPYSIKVPKDMLRLLNVSVVDSCNNLQPYSVDNGMNTLVKPKLKQKCNCHGVNGCEDALCETIDSITIVMKDIMIDGIAYTEKIWTKRTPNGDLLQIRETPVKNYASDGTFTVIIDTQEKLICSLEVNHVGCVLPTEKNVHLIITHCGACLPACMEMVCNTDISKTPNPWGRFKEECHNIFVDTTEDQVIISYQTNGNCPGEEILVPEFAVDAVMFGIDYRVKAFRPGISIGERNEAEKAFGKYREKLDHFLHPIRMEAFMRIGWQFPKWGARVSNKQSNFEIENVYDKNL